MKTANKVLTMTNIYDNIDAVKLAALTQISKKLGEAYLDSCGVDISAFIDKKQSKLYGVYDQGKSAAVKKSLLGKIEVSGESGITLGKLVNMVDKKRPTEVKRLLDELVIDGVIRCDKTDSLRPGLRYFANNNK